MTFGELNVGQLFKFFESGSLLTKASPSTYNAPQWDQWNMQTEADRPATPHTPQQRRIVIELCPLPEYDCSCKGDYCRLLQRNLK